MLIVVFQIVDLLEGFVVAMGSLLDVRLQSLILQIQSPVLLVVVHLVLLVDGLLKSH